MERLLGWILSACFWMGDFVGSMKTNKRDDPIVAELKSINRGLFRSVLALVTCSVLFGLAVPFLLHRLAESPFTVPLAQSLWEVAVPAAKWSLALTALWVVGSLVRYPLYFRSIR